MVCGLNHFEKSRVFLWYGWLEKQSTNHRMYENINYFCNILENTSYSSTPIIKHCRTAFLLNRNTAAKKIQQCLWNITCLKINKKRVDRSRKKSSMWPHTGLWPYEGNANYYFQGYSANGLWATGNSILSDIQLLVHRLWDLNTSPYRVLEELLHIGYCYRSPLCTNTLWHGALNISMWTSELHPAPYEYGC